MRNVRKVEIARWQGVDRGAGGPCDRRLPGGPAAVRRLDADRTLDEQRQQLLDVEFPCRWRRLPAVGSGGSAPTGGGADQLKDHTAYVG